MPAEEKMYTFPRSLKMYKWGWVPFNVFILLVIVFLCNAGDITNTDPKSFRNGIIVISAIIAFTLWCDWGYYKGRTLPGYIWVSEEGIRGKSIFGHEIYFTWDEITKIVLYHGRTGIELHKKVEERPFIVGTEIIGFKEELYPFIKSHAKNAKIITEKWWK